jgi:hypothetical protein
VREESTSSSQPGDRDLPIPLSENDLQYNYVPFIGSTEARKVLIAVSTVVGLVCQSSDQDLLLIKPVARAWPGRSDSDDPHQTSTDGDETVAGRTSPTALWQSSAVTAQ